jgi:hypothetical protein
MSLDEIAPSYIGEDRLDLSLDPSIVTPSAFVPLLVNVSYGRCVPQGVMLPLIFEAQGPSPESYVRRVFMRAAPSSVIFTPREGGPHLVTLREAAHNRWWGRLRLSIEGETLARRQFA